MTPSVYCYQEYGHKVQLYIDQLSTANGLRAFEGTTPIVLQHIGATSYKNFGYATVTDFPKFKTAQEFTHFLERQGDIGLIDLEIIITATLLANKGAYSAVDANNKVTTFTNFDAYAASSINKPNNR